MVAMIYLFIAGKWLDRFAGSDLRGFYALFGVALVAGVAGYLILARTPYPRAAEEVDAEAGSWLAPLREPAFRRLLCFYAAHTVPSQMASAFYSVYMISRLGLSYTHIAIYVNVAYACVMLGYLLSGNFSQRFGSRPVIQIVSVLYCLVPLAWALATPATYPVLIPVAYMIGGLSLAAILVASYTLLLNILPQGRDTANYYGLWTTVAAVASGTGPFLGALIKNLLPEAPVTVAGLEVGPIQIVFAVAAVLWIIPLAMSWRVIEEGAARPGYVLGQFRGNLLGFAWNSVLYSVAAREHTRAQAIRRLGKTRSPLAIGRLTKALQDVDPEVRSEAARGLGDAKAAEAAPSLVSHLQDEESDIRAEAAQALGKIGTGAGIDALVAALHDQLSHVRSSAALALGELNTDAAREALQAAARGPFDRATFPAVIDGASRSGDLHLVPLALGRLELLTSPVLRMQVINAVCRLLREKNHFYRLFSADQYQRAQMMGEFARRVRRLFGRAPALPPEARAVLVESAASVRQAIDGDDWAGLGRASRAAAGTVAGLAPAHPVAHAAAQAIRTYLQQVPPEQLSDEGAIFCIIALVSMARMLAGDTRG
jgi:hypothetical protein